MLERLTWRNIVLSATVVLAVVFALYAPTVAVLVTGVVLIVLVGLLVWGLGGRIADLARGRSS